MTDATNTGGGQPENPRNSEHAYEEPTDRSTDTDAADAFRSLQPGETISVHRLSPSFAQGYLDHIVVPHGEELDVMSELKANWGGGRYQLKAKRRATNGKMVFSGINATLTVAGDPTLNGQVYRNGRLVDPVPSASPHVTPQVVYAQPPGPTTNPMDPVNARILGMVESALQNAGPNAGSGTDIVGLIGALRDTLQPARPAPVIDPFKQMEQTMALLGTMQERFGGGGGGESEGGGVTGLGSGLESVIMQKILGGSAPQQPPPWQQPTQQWMQGQWGGPPQGPPPPPGSPPAGNWQNAQGQVSWQQTPPPGPPPGWAQQPPGQPPAAQQPPPPQTPPQPPETHEDSDDSDDGEEELYTVDNLMGELEEMEPGQRNQFVEELAKRFGLDKLIGQQLFNGPQTQNAAGEPIPDFSGIGPPSVSPVKP
jgi:hypothetical protein